MGDADNGGGYACVEAGDTWEISVLPPQFCCEPQIVQKRNKVLIKKKEYDQILVSHLSFVLSIILEYLYFQIEEEVNFKDYELERNIFWSNIEKLIKFSKSAYDDFSLDFHFY